MIQTANLLKENHAGKDGILFQVGSTGDFLDGETAGTISLITAAECIHWFGDYPRFFKQSALILSPHGVLAYWFYTDPKIVGFSGPSNDEDKDVLLERAMDIYRKFVYEDPNGLGPHWEQPGRGILKDYCKEVNESIPHDLYTDIVIKQYEPESGSAPSDVLDMKIGGLPFVYFMNNFKTSSAFHKFGNGDTAKQDAFIEDLAATLEKELGWDRNKTIVDISFGTGYTFMRRK